LNPSPLFLAPASRATLRASCEFPSPYHDTGAPRFLQSTSTTSNRHERLPSGRPLPAGPQYAVKLPPPPPLLPFTVHLDELYSFDPATKNWTLLSAAGDARRPSARSDHGLASAGGRLYVHGGWNRADSGAYGDAAWGRLQRCTMAWWRL
jgi:hypothetical protein